QRRLAAVACTPWFGWECLLSCAASRLPVPVHQPPQGTAIRAEVEPLKRLRYGEGSGPCDNGDDRDIVDHEVVHADEQGRALDRVHLVFGRTPELVVLVVPPPDDVR